MEIIALLIISGIIKGSVYGLVGTAFSLIFISTRVINFAQGDFVMLGAMFSVLFFVTLKMPFLLGLLIIGFLLCLAGILAERVAINPLSKQNAPVFSMVIATFGIAIILSSGAAIAGGAKCLYVQSIFKSTSIIISSGISITPQELLILIINAVLICLLYIFLKRTIWGMAIRACGQDPLAAKLMGIDVSKMIMFIFAVCAGISGIIGVLLVPLTGAFPYMGLGFSIKGFIAAVVAGMENPFAAILGGLAVGIVESFLSGYVSTAYTEAMVYGLIFLVFTLRPGGLSSQ